jgi:hypothetical protein
MTSTTPGLLAPPQVKAADMTGMKMPGSAQCCSDGEVGRDQ